LKWILILNFKIKKIKLKFCHLLYRTQPDKTSTRESNRLVMPETTSYSFVTVSTTVNPSIMLNWNGSARYGGIVQMNLFYSLVWPALFRRT
jgi:hypothetical protein